MASYTMQLREYIEAWSQTEELPVKDVIEKGRPKLFDFEYPFFDKNYKAVFETNFIRNFYMREIGYETEGLFKFQLETWLRINMPYFNKMFESEQLTFDPFINSKMDETTTKTKDTDSVVDSSTKGDSSNTNKQSMSGKQTDDIFNRQLENNTPDTRLAITTADGKGIIEYASNITESDTTKDTTNTTSVDGNGTNKSNVTGNTVTDITELESYVNSRFGKSGTATYSKMLQEYRESFVRIEKKIFAEMQQLFMLVY